MQICQVNLLKDWKGQASFLIALCPLEPELGPQVSTALHLIPMMMGSELTLRQQAQIIWLTQAFLMVFSALPGRMHLTHHHTTMMTGQKI